jgi:hypothetical protein
LNLYATNDYGLDLADVRVIKDEGELTEERIDGSLVWDEVTNTLSFVKTGGVLPAGDYTVSLVSTVDVVLDPVGIVGLDGNSDGTAGDDYEDSFTVGSDPVAVVYLPDFTRGAGQPVVVPATDAVVPKGLPIRIDDAIGVDGLDFEIVFDPALLTISGYTIGADLPPGWVVNGNLLGADDGVVRFSVYGGQTALTGTNLEIIVLTAEVPDAAGYRDSQVIRINDLSINDGQIASKADYAVHSAAYFGDADGDGSYIAYDAALISRVAAHMDSGFAAYPLIDPVVIGDVSGNGEIGSMDASYVARKALGLPQAEIPDLPAMPDEGGASPAAPAESASSSGDGRVAAATAAPASQAGRRAMGPARAADNPSRKMLSDPRGGAARAADAAVADEPAGFDRGMLYAAGWFEHQTKDRAKGKHNPGLVDDVFAVYGLGEEGI